MRGLPWWPPHWTTTNHSQHASTHRLLADSAPHACTHLVREKRLYGVCDLFYHNCHLHPCTLVRILWSQTIPGFTNEPWVAPSLPIVRSIIIHPKISNSRDGKIHKLCKWNGAIFEWLIFGVCTLILVYVFFSGANFSAAKSC